MCERRELGDAVIAACIARQSGSACSLRFDVGGSAVAEHDAALFEQAAFVLGRSYLHFDCTRASIDRTGEFDEHAVANHLDYPAVMLIDKRADNLAAPRLECGERAGLILLHEPAVADDIGGQDSGKATLDAFLDHCGGLPLESAVPVDSS